MERKKDIKILFDSIVKKYDLKDPKDWINRDHQFLNRIIDDKLQDNLNVRTIRRIIESIYLEKTNYTPKITTLDLLSKLLNHTDWEEFKLANKKQFIPDSQIKKRNNKKIITVIISLILSILVISYSSYFFLTPNNTSSQTKTPKILDVKFNFDTNILVTPNSFRLKYTIPKDINDSVFVHSYCDHRAFHKQNPIHLNKEDTMMLLWLREAGLYNIILKEKSSQTKAKRLFLTTPHWQYTIYNQYDRSLGYSKIKPQKGIFEIGLEDFNKLKTPPNNISSNRAKFVYINPFNISLDCCSVKIRLKNNYKIGANCNQFKTIIYGKNNDIRMLFGAKNCPGNTTFNVSDTTFENKIHDLESLRYNFSEFTELGIFLKNNNFELHLDNKPALNLNYKKPLGNLNGFVFWFMDGGAIDYVKVYDNNQNLIYNEDFDSIQ